MIFGLFKMIGGVASFVANIILCVTSDNIADVVKDFVAVMIISQVDDLMVATLTVDDTVEPMRVYVHHKQLRFSDLQVWEQYFQETNVVKSAIKYNDYTEPLDLLSKLFLVLSIIVYRLVSIFYHVIYFYFAPFIITLIVIYTGVVRRSGDDSESV